MLRVLRSGIAAGVNAEATAMHTASKSAFVAILQSLSSQTLGQLRDLKNSGSTAPRSSFVPWGRGGLCVPNSLF